MRYEGNIFRPPSEAYSLIIQATIGCAHNDCTFCSSFKSKIFRVRPMDEIVEDLEYAKQIYGDSVRRIFFADGDVLVLSNDKLLTLLAQVKRLFPSTERVSVYGSPQDVLRKTPTELEKLRDAGMGIIYIGGESGSDEVLKNVKKGATAAELIEAIRKVEAAGIATSVTFISGLGGTALWREHAVATGRMISEAEPTYASLLTLMIEPAAPIYHDLREGRFELLTPSEVIEETVLLVENINVKNDCIFRSNHASNYFSLKGTLPHDKERLLAELDIARENEAMLKDERFRML